VRDWQPSAGDGMESEPKLSDVIKSIAVQALHKKYPLRMLFVRKAGLFDLEKLSKRDQKVLVDR
jgi:hypothetical protein